MKKVIIYYTCNTHRPDIEEACRERLRESANGIPIIAVSLQQIDFGDQCIVLDLKRSPETMYRQIMPGLLATQADVVFFCESDVFYDPSHFDFVPAQKDTFYYNTNVWRVRYKDGHAVRTDDCRQLSGTCVDRNTALIHMGERIEKIAKD